MAERKKQLEEQKKEEGSAKGTFIPVSKSGQVFNINCK